MTNIHYPDIQFFSIKFPKFYSKRGPQTSFLTTKMDWHKFKPKTKIINLYLFKETVVNFGVCIFIFTLTTLMGQIFKLTEMVINKRFGFWDTLQLLGLILPSLLMFVIPMGLLLGILTTLGRMSTDGEIIAFKASGFSLSQIFRPILVVSLFAFLISSIFTLYLSPQANHTLQKLIFDIAKTKAEVGIKERIFNSDFEGLTLYVNRTPPQGGKLEGIIVSDTRQAEEPSTILAKEGYLIPNPEDLEVTLQLKNGSLHRLSQKNKKYQKINFDTYNLKLNLQKASTEKTSSKRKEMSTSALWHLAMKNKSNNAKYYPILVDLHSRFAIPFACLVFGVLAVPLGIFLPRSGRAYGFVISLIVILFYYILFSFGENIGSLGIVQPMISIWFPNLFFFLVAIFLFKKTKTESSIMILEKLAWYMEILKTKIRSFTEGAKPEETDSLSSVIWDINNSSKESLMLKLGVGEKRATAIIAYRDTHGGLKRLEELKEVKGISDKTFHTILENLLG